MDEKEIEPNLSSYDYNNIISTRMISNFRNILEKYPEGILASELPDKYCVSAFVSYFINICSLQDNIISFLLMETSFSQSKTYRLNTC